MRHEKSFTLIELLVVVAIIAVLVAILLPGLKAARDRAKTIACLSVDHQIGIATTAYMDSNAGWLPMPIRYVDGGWPDWGSLLSPQYMPMIPQDPAAKGEKDPRWGHEIGGYGMNAYWIVMGTWYGENKDYQPSIVLDPSREVVFGDNRGMWNVGPLLDVYDVSIHPGFWGGGDDRDAQRCRMAARHSGSPNMIFLDMHAEHITVEQAMAWSEFWIRNAWWPPPPCWLPQWN